MLCLKKDKDKRFLHVEYKVEVKELLTLDQVTERRLITSAVPSDDGENLAGISRSSYRYIKDISIYSIIYNVLLQIHISRIYRSIQSSIVLFQYFSTFSGPLYSLVCISFILSITIHHLYASNLCVKLGDDCQ